SAGRTAIRRPRIRRSSELSPRCSRCCRKRSRKSWSRAGWNGSWAMASSRKPRSADVPAAVRRAIEDLRGKRFLAGLSGGVDSVVLVHALVQEGLQPRAVHVHHGLSPNADKWARFCRRLCKRLGVPLTVRRVRVAKRNEASARAARYAAFRKLAFEVLALAHQLDDQAETVLLNL